MVPLIRATKQRSWRPSPPIAHATGSYCCWIFLAAHKWKTVNNMNCKFYFFSNLLFCLLSVTNFAGCGTTTTVWATEEHRLRRRLQRRPPGPAGSPSPRCGAPTAGAMHPSARVKSAVQMFEYQRRLLKPASVTDCDSHFLVLFFLSLMATSLNFPMTKNPCDLNR